MSKKNRVAILIVNGGNDPEEGHWISLCIGKLIELTTGIDYQVFVWNNNTSDSFVSDFLRFAPRCEVVQAPEGVELSHPHAEPLQRLYEMVRDQGFKYIVTMDSDAHPISKDWLETLVSELDGGTAVAGVWRDELKDAIAPYVHASCLATTVDFIESNSLRLDLIAANQDDLVHDTLSSFTETAESQGLSIFRLKRSNTRDFHRLMGGVYGGKIYHHGAGSRIDVSFWGEDRTDARMNENFRIGEVAAKELFENYGPYMEWLNGTKSDYDFEEVLSADRTDQTQRSARKLENKVDSPQEPYGNTERRGVGGSLRAKLIDRLGIGREQRFSCVPSLMSKPFEKSDLRQVPKSWNIRGPDFVGIGAPKSGTSWWYEAMISHPRVFPHRLFDEDEFLATKELHYFTQFGWNGPSRKQSDTYKAAFASPNEAVTGEWSALYFMHPLSLRYLSECSPETKILLMLRNPIDRFVSHVNHLVKNRGLAFGLSGDWLKYFEKYSATSEAFLHSCYARGLTELCQRFEREQILCLQYELCKSEPEKQLEKTFSFLGLDATFSPKSMTRPVNKQGYVIEKPGEKSRELLAELFMNDVEKTKEFFPDLDIGLWPDFYR